jgi:hypothetical protein
MQQYNFGTGQVFAIPSGQATPTPMQFGTLQDISVDFDATVKDLVGQQQFAVALARGQIKVSGKAKYARLSAAAFNNIFFGQALGTAGSGPQTLVPASPGEAHSVPGSSTYTIQATNHATFVSDLGVTAVATGTQYTRVAAASEVAGVSYSVVPSTGTYTFASGDAGLAMIINYSYTATTGSLITITNQLMGVTPSFSLNLFESYTNNGVGGSATLILNNVTSKKLGLAFKNEDWTMIDLDFTAAVDATGTLGTFSMTGA